MAHGISQLENRSWNFKRHVTFSSGFSGGGEVGNGKAWFVDGDRAASGSGKSWDEAFTTIQEGVTAASAGDVVYVVAKTLTDYTGDPTSYAETVIIPYATSSLALIGVSRGRTQGGLPQIRKGSGSTALITVRAPGCLIANMGFNGAGSTGGGILLDDDYAAKAAFGTTIVNCHFKNCKCHATDGRKGGAIYTTANGNCWQLLVSGCRFYRNLADVALVGTSSTVPQDWVIEDCIFSGPAASVDVNLFLKGGSGVNGVHINNCIFPALPAVGSGSVVRFMDLTGCVGVLSNCMFGCATQGAGLVTFKAAGTGALVPTSVFLSGNYGEADTEGDTGYIYRSA